jgi:hypothetical protein
MNRFDNPSARIVGTSGVWHDPLRKPDGAGRRGIDMKLWTILAATTMFAAIPQADAQNATGTPAFRVPIGTSGSVSSAPPVYAWMQTVGTCSNACGDGTRPTTYQCQDVNAYDFSGGGYGAPEPNAACSAAGPMPASTSANCTNYSGCSYDWVNPAVSVTRIAKPNPSGGTFPIGAVDACSYARRTFSPICQRAGSPTVTMPAGDHAFCRNDMPDYAAVAAGDPDALGYDRTNDQTTACVQGARDYDWKASDWTVKAPTAPATQTCSDGREQTRTVDCVLKFNGSIADPSQCSGITKPATTGTSTGVYSGCTNAWETGTYGSWSSGCSTSATHTRTVLCRRSDGKAVADSECTAARPASSETGSNLVSCGYEWTTPTEWVSASKCSTNTTQTRTTTCKRSDGATVADGMCPAASKPSLYQAGQTDLTACTYAPRDMGKSTCTNNQQDQYWDCTRSDGTTGFPASFCGKTNPQPVGCVSPPVYTYTPRKTSETACANSQKQVYWDCTRNDGQTGFPASQCGKASPETQGCTMAYTWNWAVGPWSGYNSTCSANASQTRSVSCVRSDGAVDGDQNCNAAARPPSGETAAIYSGCGYQTEAISNYTSCGSNGTQTRQVQCRRSDGTVVANSYCNSSGVQTQSCTYTPTYGNTCDGGTAIGEYGDWYGNGSHTGVSWAGDISSCNAHGGNCVQANNSRTNNDEQGGDQGNNTIYTCYKDSAGLKNGWCQPNTNGGCAPSAEFKKPPQWEFVYSAMCVGGQEIANGGSFWSGGYQSPYGPNAPEKGLTTVDQCQALGGNCFQKYTEEHSEYGTYETRQMGYRCFKGSTDAHYDANYYNWDMFGYSLQEAAIYR